MREVLYGDGCRGETASRDGNGPIDEQQLIQHTYTLQLSFTTITTTTTGIRAAPASILLHGPPGCGKTKLAKAVAGEAQAAYLSVGPSDILSKYVGESEASVRGLFLEGE